MANPTRRNKALTSTFTINPLKCRDASVRYDTSRRAGYPVSEMRRSLLSGVLCIFVIGLILSPGKAVASTGQEAKELFKLYTHTQLLSNKQYYCIEKLWDRESRWDPTARNPKSTAYGIPQLLKLKETNPFRQIDAGLRYIAHRYGTPCAAYLHHKKVGHY